MPWFGVPHAGHGSGLVDLISAPQHPQNAAISDPLVPFDE
jgi:hypothetical protein